MATGDDTARFIEQLKPTYQKRSYQKLERLVAQLQNDKQRCDKQR